jgi:hypothetical protein
MKRLVLWRLFCVVAVVVLLAEIAGGVALGKAIEIAVFGGIGSVLGGAALNMIQKRT